MKEHRTASDAIAALTLHENVGVNEDRTPRAIFWAPGDMTKYTVALLKMRPFEYTGASGESKFLLVICGGKHLIIPRPLSEWSEYSVEQFLTKFGEDYAGWWGAIRPLLAALCWTPVGDRSPDFSPGDAARIGALLRRH